MAFSTREGSLAAIANNFLSKVNGFRRTKKGGCMVIADSLFNQAVTFNFSFLKVNLLNKTTLWVFETINLPHQARKEGKVRLHHLVVVFPFPPVSCTSSCVSFQIVCQLLNAYKDKAAQVYNKRGFVPLWCPFCSSKKPNLLSLWA